MKAIIVTIILFTLASSIAFADLTKQDLEEIRAIVKESEERLNKRIDSVEANLDTRISDFAISVRWMIGILASIVIASLVLPQFLGRLKKEESSVAELRELRERMDKLEAQLGSK